MTLTVKGLEKLKAPDNGKTLSDGGSLYGKVRIKADGTPSVFFNFRYRGNGGKTREKHVGTWPASSLADIRSARNKLRAKVEAGIDPIDEDRATAEAAKIAVEKTSHCQTKNNTLTWDQLFKQWDDQYGVTLDSHWRANRRSQWKCHLSPSIGKLHLLDATRQPLLNHHENKVKEGKSATSRKALAFMIQMVKWAVKHDYLPEGHPMTRLTLPTKVKQVRENQRQENFDIDEFFATHGEEAIGNDHGLDAAGRALPFLELITLLHERLPVSGQAETGKCVIRLMLATGIRASEMVRLRWRWVSFDRKLMIIPAGGMKKGRMHHVHLSDFALRQLRLMDEQKTNEFVFPAPNRKNAAVRRDNVGTDIRLRQFYPATGETEEQVAIRLELRMRNRRAREDYQRYNLPGGNWTLYDMRRTVATRLEELGFERYMVAAVLAHARDDAATTGRYARFSHWEKRCAALDALGEALTSCEAGTLPTIAKNQRTLTST